jgi:hypothetical protein
MAMDEQVADEAPRGLIASLMARLRRMWSAVATHCEQVDAAKAACDRNNTLKHGKDWVNRCCG